MKKRLQRPEPSRLQRRELPVRPLPIAGKVEPTSSGSFLGVYSPPAPFRNAPLDDFLRASDKGVGIVMWYQPWSANGPNRFDSAACVGLYRRGMIPLITWEPWDPGRNANLLEDPAGQANYRLSRILSGRFDGYIRSWARSIRKLGGPVMLRPMHEMNGNWYPWCGGVNGNKPGEYKAAWIRIHRIFEEEGATNVTWVWSMNHASVPETRENNFLAYYPGSRYVDWTGISGFNWGTSSRFTRWRSFSHWYDKPLAFLSKLGKPIVIAEFGSVEQGGSKAEWLLDAYKKMRGYPRVKAVIYYNAVESDAQSRQDWRIRTSRESVSAFRKSVAPSYYLPDAPEALQEWSGRLKPYDWQYLATVNPIY